MAYFIFDTKIHKKKFNNFPKTGIMRKLKLLYKKHGILSEELLKKLLSNQGCTDTEVDFILMLAEEMLIMASIPKLPIEVNDSGVTETNFFIVPSMTPRTLKKKQVEVIGIKGKITWKTDLPDGFLIIFAVV